MTHPKPICSFTSRLLAISLLLIATLPATAQQKKKMVAEPDTIPLFRGVAVSADLAGIAQLALSDYGQYEAALRVNLRDKYFPVIELGMGKADANDVATNLTYKSSAPYGRIGVDFNVMKNKHDINRVYVGGRYAFSSFDFDVSSPGITDPVWGDVVEYNHEGNKATWHWMEFVAGIDAKIWKMVRLGWSVRYKRRLSNKDPEIGKPWYVPGYGKEGGSRIGASFNLIFEL
ncbi:MAG: DUF6048 family protein [Prevotella sp.]